MRIYFYIYTYNTHLFGNYIIRYGFLSNFYIHASERVFFGPHRILNIRMELAFHTMHLRGLVLWPALHISKCCYQHLEPLYRNKQMHAAGTIYLSLCLQSSA